MSNQNKILFSYFIFPSIHTVLKAEKLLKSHAVSHTIVPVPKAISSNCGVAVRVQPDEAIVLQATALLDKHQLKYKHYQNIKA